MRGYIKRILSPGKVYVGGAVTLRTVVCGLFIALIALFFTCPEPHSIYDKPLPMPAGMGID